MTHENVQETIKHFQISMIDKKNDVYKGSQKIIMPSFREKRAGRLSFLLSVVNLYLTQGVENVFYVCLLFELWYIRYFVRERRECRENLFSLNLIYFQWHTSGISFAPELQTRFYDKCYGKVQDGFMKIEWIEFYYGSTILWENIAFFSVLTQYQSFILLSIT